MDNEVVVNEKLPGEDALATCQVVEKAIIKISGTVKLLRAQKETLESVSNNMLLISSNLQAGCEIIILLFLKSHTVC